MNRVLVAHTPLGDTWWATTLQGEEAFSSLYEFRLELKSKKSDIDAQSLIGEVCAVACEGNLTAIRYFSGLIIDAAARGKSGKHWLYELLIAPKLWFASRRADFRIFQNQTVQAIADQILQQNAIIYEWRLKNSYKTWEYVVQYGETDLAFLLRLFGHEGIYFWFEHSANGDKLILGDHFSTHEPFAGYETIPYYPPDASRVGEDHFNAWHASRMPKSGRYVHTNYDFKQPSADLKAEFAEPRGHLFDQYEIFAYPGTYAEPEQQHGQEYAMARLHGLQVGQDTIVLEGEVRGVIPGHCFTLKKHPVQSQNREFLITKAEYRAQNNEYESGDSVQPEGASFYVKVSAMPANRQYRTPAENFRRPRAHGVDTAVVVGPEGSEIHTDEYGRVKVHFHWDRYGQRDGDDSCWIRVAYPWAGSNFGSIHIPRVGQEVIVDYEHGDPQRPIITGRVYNAQQMPPWDLPANKTQSGILTRSSSGGSSSNANALRFEDAQGKEEVWLHAEKDQRIEVENDENHSVGSNRSKSVGNNETVSIGVDRTETVGSNETVTIGAAHAVTVGAGQTFGITGDQTFTVTGNNSYAATESTSLSAGTTFDASSGEDMTLVSGTKISHGVESAGIVIDADSVSHGVGESSGIVVEADSITHAVGGSSGTRIEADSISHAVGDSSGTRIEAASITHGVGDSGIKIDGGSIVLSAGGSVVKINDSGVIINGTKIYLNC
jgi:type VI secretion system secreted protein VgrG